MTAEELAESARRASAPPPGLNMAQRALWLAAAGDWHGAHDLCQDIPDPTGAWIHAHLHRQEGDLGNARYWYERASRPFPRGVSIEDEWLELARALRG